MACLVDTNVLVYRHDPRSPEKQDRAIALLRDGLAADQIRISHQAIVEFVTATSRRLAGSQVSLLTPEESRREAEELINQFPILYPSDAVLRLALRGAAAYQLSWFDAHLWAYAEHYGLEVLYSEDFQHERMYGTVQVLNPFISEAVGTLR